jgi:ribosomal protein L11 methyltransferase
MQYIALTVTGLSPDDADTLSAMMMESGFEGTETTDDGFKAFIDFEHFTSNGVEAWLPVLEEAWACRIEKETIAPANWNAEWEKNFEPVAIGGQVYIRAPFHAVAEGYAYELIIEPKMSFGTGHHATTHMMVEWLLALDVAGKTVLDVGTGTGVLAIMAAKRGAAEITGTDIEDWCLDNAGENIIRNNCADIKIQRAETFNAAPASFDLIMANIQRSYFEENLHALANYLHSGGMLITSGYLQQDSDIMQQLGVQAGLTVQGERTNGNWMSHAFLKA